MQTICWYMLYFCSSLFCVCLSILRVNDLFHLSALYRRFTIAPAQAVPKAVARAGLQMAQIDFFEVLCLI